METLSPALVFVRAILYPIAGFMLLTMAFSANNRNKAIMFRTHILIAILLFILGAMAAVRLIYDDNVIISNIGNVAITPLLIILIVNSARLAVREEKNFIRSIKEQKNERC